jgi:aspartate kinase
MAEVAVLKIGGSVLSGADPYRRAATFLRDEVTRTRSRIVAVVSAESGHTDRLWAEAQSVADVVDDDARDLLWSTGELRSVALLTIALRATGLSASGLNVHETGLRVADRGANSDALVLNPLPLRAAIARHDVVVVPGFLATCRQQVVTLGRGGSDWSAVALAAALQAARCELIKDVPGYFTADPRTAADAALIDALDYTTALAMADNGCPLVQRQAIEHARRARLPLVVRSFDRLGTRLETPAHAPVDARTSEVLIA